MFGAACKAHQLSRSSDLFAWLRYKKAVEYWDGQEASYNGVLGGFGFVSDIDVRDSRELIQKVRKRAVAHPALTSNPSWALQQHP
jgi:hypothetical protein